MDTIKLVWPLIVIELGLQIYALIDLIRKRKTKSLSPVIWGVIIILGGILGPVLYLLLGRNEE